MSDLKGGKMPKTMEKKDVDKRILTIIDVYGEKKLRIKQNGFYIFLSLEDKDSASFELLFPQRTDLQKQRYLLLDKIVHDAYKAGYTKGLQERAD